MWFSIGNSSSVGILWGFQHQKWWVNGISLWTMVNYSDLSFQTCEHPWKR
jgi:hypothetical protein